MSGDSLNGQGGLFQQTDGGSIPTSPLQISAKDLIVFRIDMGMADKYSIEHHYLHRTAKNSKIAFGVRSKHDTILRGIVIWGAPVAKINQKVYMELRRMFLEDSLPKNSESRVMSICIRQIKRLFPNVRLLISYSDLSMGHSGTIYKASGWINLGVIKGDPNGGWGTTHKGHKRVEYSDKRKWGFPL